MVTRRDGESLFRYGQTEQAAVAILTYSGETQVILLHSSIEREGYSKFQCHNIGVPVPWCEMKLADVPHMGYYAKDDR